MTSAEQIDHYITIGKRVSGRYQGVVCSFVSGSLIEGMGNATSDLDVFVVTPHADVEPAVDAVAFSLGEARIDVNYEPDIRVDTEVWTIQSIRAAASQIRDVPMHDRAAMSSIDESRLQLAHRIRVGVPVVNPEMFAALRDLVDCDRLAFILATRFLHDYLGYAEDAAGAINAGDGGTALLTSRAALGSSVDAYLAAHGETNAKPKWRVQKLRRHGDSELLDRYLRHELDERTDEAALIASGKRRLRAANWFAQRARQQAMSTEKVLRGAVQ